MAYARPEPGASAGGSTTLGTIYDLPPNSGGGQQQQPQPGQSPYDYSGDPILQKILAYDAAQRANAQAAATAARKALAIQFGDASGVIDDEATAAAAKNNPYSILANLKRGYDQTVFSHGEQINKGNLWYSGFHAKTAADDATGYGQQQYDARQQVLGQLGNINSSLAQQLAGYDQSDIAAQTDAAGRAQQQALAYGFNPGGSSSGSPVANALSVSGPASGTGGFVNRSSPPQLRNAARMLLPRVKPPPTNYGSGPYIGTLR